MKGEMLAIAVAFWTMSSVGAAQSRTETDTGSLLAHPERARIPDSGTQAERSRTALAEFARCTVDRHAARLTRLLRLPANETDSRAWGLLADAECLSNGTMRFKAILLRESIFTELYRRRIAGSASTRAHLVTAAPYLPFNSTYENGPDATLLSGLLALGACVVKENRTDASAMVAAATASAAQNAALSALRPSLAMCLPPGQQISLSRPVLEGSIAEVLYREPAHLQPVGSN